MHAQDALRRAENSRSLGNIGTVYAALAAAGLTGTHGIDVLTFAAWRAKGRCVRKGEKALCFLATIIPTSKQTDDGVQAGKLMRRVAVFHFSQTDALQ